MIVDRGVGGHALDGFAEAGFRLIEHGSGDSKPSPGCRDRRH